MGPLTFANLASSSADQLERATGTDIFRREGMSATFIDMAITMVLFVVYIFGGHLLRV